MKIYLSGISHDTDVIETERLKTILVSLGCDLLVLEETVTEQGAWTEKLRSRLGLLQDCPVIYMLPDWKNSILARIELTAAMNDKKYLCFSPEDIRNIITTLDG
jgi:hypothetical protein